MKIDWFINPPLALDSRSQSTNTHFGLKKPINHHSLWIQEVNQPTLTLDWRSQSTTTCFGFKKSINQHSLWIEEVNQPTLTLDWRSQSTTPRFGFQKSISHHSLWIQEANQPPLALKFTPVLCILMKRLWISWFPRLHFCGRCRSLEFTITIDRAILL